MNFLRRADARERGVFSTSGTPKNFLLCFCLCILYNLDPIFLFMLLYLKKID